MPNFLRLEYPISKPYPWPYFTPIVLPVAVVCITVLTVLNAAIVGYETVTVFKSDFNALPSLWYDHFTPPGFRSTPGSLCNPHGFNVGNSFTTNYSLFQWDLLAVETDLTPSDNMGNLVYSGSTLETCDIAALFVDAYIQGRTADVAAIISCDDVGGSKLLAKTSFSVTVLTGKYSPPLLGSTPERFNISREGKSRANMLDLMIRLATDDCTPSWDAMLSTPGRFPDIISGNGFLSPCPASLGTDAACANKPPPIRVSNATVMYPNGNHSTFDTSLPDSDTNRPLQIIYDIYPLLNNFAQTIFAAVRIDLGNPSPNNFMLNPSVLNATLVGIFPANNLTNASVSSLYEANANSDPRTQGMLPLTVEGPANIQVLYSCQFRQRKTLGQAFISVLVATLSMFSAGWTVFTFFASYYAERK